MATWQEDINELLAFHEKMLAERGSRKAGRPATNAERGWSVRDTAAHYKIGHGTVWERLKLARAMRDNKHLRNAPTLRIALAKCRLIREEANHGRK